MAEGITALITPPIDLDREEASLVASARKDRRYFGRLYVLYVDKVYRYLFSLTGSAPEAEDLTAQTFLAALEAFDQYRQSGHFSAWLFSIARNKAMDHFRRQKRLAPIEDIEEAPADDDPLHEVIQAEQASTLAALIKALPEEERDLLRLRFLASMSFPAMAQLLQRSEDSVKKSYYRLLARLKNQTR